MGKCNKLDVTEHWHLTLLRIPQPTDTRHFRSCFLFESMAFCRNCGSEIAVRISRECNKNLVSNSLKCYNIILFLIIGGKNGCDCL